MKTNVCKKVLALVAVMLLCLGMAACNDGREQPSDNSPADSTAQTESVKTTVANMPAEEEKQPTYYYAGVEGAVIVEQNGTQYYVYCHKCERCGKVESNMKRVRHGGGNLTSSYFCPDCKQSQRVEIKETVNW